MAETTRTPELERITIRNVDMETWRRLKAQASREGRDMGAYLSGVLADWCDYQD